MFTGLVEGIGRVVDASLTSGDMRITVKPAFDMSDSRIGDSISVNGVCLTITDIKKDIIGMDVSQETISSSTIGSLKQDSNVNLERALSLSGRLGGHLVSGHVDGVGRILKKQKVRGSWVIRVGIDEFLSKYTIEKGSIAVDGISFTINACGNSFFEVNIIPETGRETIILNKKEGDLVNIETDLIAKYLEKILKKGTTDDGHKASSNIDMEMLSRFGFGE